MVCELVNYIVWLLAYRGSRRYCNGSITHLEHALQCAALAEAGGASQDLIVASLLHDLGHLMHEPGSGAAPRAVNERHEYRPLRVLRRHFGEAVIAPIRLHVEAKRYLCAVQPGYWDALSPASRVSLQVHGGIQTQAEAARFVRERHANDAVRLRLWDDRARTRSKSTPHLFYYTHMLLHCAHEARDPHTQPCVA